MLGERTAEPRTTTRELTMKRAFGFVLLFAVLGFASGCGESKTKAPSDGKPPTPPPGPTGGKMKKSTPVAPKAVD
jgi:hypothetical protein